MNIRVLLKPVLLIALLIVVLILAVILANFSRTSPAETAGTHTFFEQFVISGGPIVWFVLLPMSMVAVFLAAEHFLTIRRKKLLPEDITDRIVQVAQLLGSEKLHESIGDNEDFVSRAVSRSAAQSKGDWFRMRNLLFESLQEQALSLVRRIEWLSLIGNVSPMVGLFGTVFGMIKLFNVIVISSGQPQPAQLAEGISVALVTTFWGLFIAIPALALHGFFRNRIETILSEAVIKAEDIMPVIRQNLKRQSHPQTEQIPKQSIQQIEVRASQQTEQPQSL